MRFQTEKVAKEIKMWENAKIGFVEMNEDKNMKDGVRAQIAKTNGVILNQSAEEQMDRNAKSVIEIIFKHDQFITAGGRKALTASRTPSHHHRIRQHAIHHQLVEHRLIADGAHRFLGAIELARCPA